MKLVVALVIAVWAGACASRASDPPAIAIDRSACSRCGMLISERAHAAAVRSADGHDQLFDDIGCLVATVRAGLPHDVQYWFNDAADGEWIRSVDPTFVVAASLRTPMGGGIVAYRDRAAAERFARTHDGKVVAGVAALIEEGRNSR